MSEEARGMDFHGHGGWVLGRWLFALSLAGEHSRQAAQVADAFRHPSFNFGSGILHFSDAPLLDPFVAWIAWFVGAAGVGAFAWGGRAARLGLVAWILTELLLFGGLGLEVNAPERIMAWAALGFLVGPITGSEPGPRGPIGRGYFLIWVSGMYLMAGGLKATEEPGWWDGTILAQALCDPIMGGTPWGIWASGKPALTSLLSWCTIAFEVAFVFLVWSRRFNPPILLAGVVYHACVSLVMDVGTLGLAVLSTYPILLDPDFAERLRGRLRARVGSGALRARRWPWKLVSGVLAGLGCAGSDRVEDTAPAQDPTPSFDIVMIEEWLQLDLPSGDLGAGSQPGIAVGDLDGDGWLDALLAYPGGSVGFRNDGSGALLADPAFTVDGGAVPAAEAVALADLDADGDLDAVLGRWYDELDLLLWNDGAGRFAATPLEGSEGAAFTPSFLDMDNDGDLDLVLAAGSSSLSLEDILAGNERGDPNLVYRNEPEGFVRVPDALPTVGVDGITFQLSPFDSDGDGDLDLYSANDAGPYVERNHLLINDGTGHFADAPDCHCDLAMFSMGAAVGDANQDGLPDLYVTNVGSPKLLLNLGDNAFVEASAASGAEIPATPESLVSWGTVFADLDADRDHDLVVTFGRGGDEAKLAAVDPDYTQSEEQPDVLLVSDGAGGFFRGAPSFADPDPTRAVAVGDFDRDGRPDLLTAGKYFMRQWRAEGGFDPGITLVLHGGADNPHGLGARVDVTLRGVTRSTWALPSSMGSSSAHEVYIGLGGGSSAEELLIVWPNGDRTVRSDVAAGWLEVSQDEP